MRKKKTTLTQEQVTAFLQRQFAQQPENLQRLVEGEESQAFSYVYDGEAYVLRVHHHLEGFQKDAYAAAHFHSACLPLPRIIQLGSIDAGHTFCLAEKCPGFTLQEADSQTIQRVLEPTMHTWLAFQDCDLHETSGFGDFGADGQGISATWREFLLSILDAPPSQRRHVMRFMGATAYTYLRRTLTSLVPFCPEERTLVHGDFGSNNVLTDGHVITAVLDWEAAKYGDPLFDIATAYFWRPWLACMSAQATYYEATLSTWPWYHERLLCYQLRIGLQEIHDALMREQWTMAQWAIRRSTEIAASL